MITEKQISQRVSKFIDSLATFSWPFLYLIGGYLCVTGTSALGACVMVIALMAVLLAASGES